MLKSYLLLFILIYAQISALACPADKIYKYKAHTAPVYATSTQKFYEHLSGVKVQEIVLGKSKHLIKLGLHSYPDLIAHMKKAQHLNYMLTRSGQIQHSFLESLENGMLLVYLPKEAYIDDSFKRILKRSQLSRDAVNRVLTKKVNGTTYYSHNVFPREMSPPEIEIASLQMLEDSQTIFNEPNIYGYTRARGFFRTTHGHEVPTFVIFNSDLELVSAYPDFHSVLRL